MENIKLVVTNLIGILITTTQNLYFWKPKLKTVAFITMILGIILTIVTILLPSTVYWRQK